MNSQYDNFAKNANPKIKWSRQEVSKNFIRGGIPDIGKILAPVNGGGCFTCIYYNIVNRSKADIVIIEQEPSISSTPRNELWQIFDNIVTSCNLGHCR